MENVLSRKYMHRLLLILLLSSSVSIVSACDSCRIKGDPQTGGSVALSAGIGEHGYKWQFDVSYEYRNWKRMDNDRALAVNESGDYAHTHGVIDDWFINARMSYRPTNDITIGITQGYRHLREVNVHDEDLLGQHFKSEGTTDVELDVDWRFLHQRKDGFPVDLSVFAALKPPTGRRHDHDPQGEWIDAENQPGTGSWDGTLGFAASRRWDRWGASGSASFTLKGEGSQHFKAGDVFRLTFGGARQMMPANSSTKIYLSLGAQAVQQFQGTEHGEVDRNHGGQFLYLVPGVTIEPMKRLGINLAAPIPVYQDVNGFHQKENYTLRFGITLRF